MLLRAALQSEDISIATAPARNGSHLSMITTENYLFHSNDTDSSLGVHLRNHPMRRRAILRITGIHGVLPYSRRMQNTWFYFLGV